MYNTLGSEKSFALYNEGEVEEFSSKIVLKEGRQNKLAQKGRRLKKENVAWGEKVKQLRFFSKYFFGENC